MSTRAKSPESVYPTLTKLIRQDAVRAELEKLPEPPLTRKHDPQHETMWNVLRKFKEAGFGKWSPLWGAAAMGIALGFILHMAPPVRTWRVLERSSDYRFVIQEFKDGAPQQAKVYDFCRDGYRAQFEQGFTLTSFTYKQRGECVSLEGLHYTILRDSTLCPVVPRNCSRNCVPGNTEHVACVGSPQFD